MTGAGDLSDGGGGEGTWISSWGRQGWAAGGKEGAVQGLAHSRYINMVSASNTVGFRVTSSH